MTPYIKTEVKKAFIQPVIGIEPATGCLVSLILEYNSNTVTP
jgi:hypothetical protein